MKKQDKTPPFVVFLAIAVGMAILVLFWKYVAIVLLFAVLIFTVLFIWKENFRNWVKSKFKKKPKVEEIEQKTVYRLKDKKPDISSIDDDTLIDELIKRGKIEKK